MNPLRVVIVEDEAPARERLTALLAVHADVTVVGEAGDVDTAVDLCLRVNPDLVFLDVQLRGETGFDLLPRLSGAPAIVFVTAHDAFAVRAFDVNALDYLLKPVHPDRLAAALARARASTAAAPSPLQTPTTRLRADDVVALRDEGGLRLVPLKRITHVEAEENYTRVHVAHEPPAFVRRTMAEWRRILPEPQFLQVSRSLIVQKAAVRELQAHSRDVAHLLLAGQSAPVVVARRASMRIRQALGGR